MNNTSAVLTFNWARLSNSHFHFNNLRLVESFQVRFVFVFGLCSGQLLFVRQPEKSVLSGWDVELGVEGSVLFLVARGQGRVLTRFLGAFVNFSRRFLLIYFTSAY